MRFVVHALDKPGALPRRLEALAAHRAYLEEAPARHGVSVLLSGPMTEDDGETMMGSFFLLEAPDRRAVELMFADDPMALADVWAERHVTAVSIRVNTLEGPNMKESGE